MYAKVLGESMSHLVTNVREIFSKYFNKRISLKAFVRERAFSHSVINYTLKPLYERVLNNNNNENSPGAYLIFSKRMPLRIVNLTF